MKITAEQIQKLGWNMKVPTDKENTGIYGTKGFLRVYINFTFKDYTPCMIQENGSVIFKGNCNTIEDFKTILRLLNK